MRRLLATLLVLLLLTAGTVAWINHRVRSHAYTPRLVRLHQAAPALALRTLDGAPAEVPRGRVVVVNLWATWCLPCLAEMRTFEALYRRFRDDPEIAFLFVSTSDTAAQVRAFAASHQLDLPFYLAADGMATSPDPMTGPSLPTTWILAPDGSLAARQSGAADWSDACVAEFLESLKSR